MYKNDVTVLRGGGGEGFCDDSTKTFVKKRVTMGVGGVKNYPKLRYVIYGRPLCTKIASWYHSIITEQFPLKKFEKT